MRTHAEQQELDEQDRVLTIASRIYGPISVATQTYTKVGPAKAVAVEEAIKESVEVARRMIAHVQSSSSSSQVLATVTQQVAGFPPPASPFPPPAPPFSTPASVVNGFPPAPSQHVPAGYIPAVVRPATPPITPAAAFPKPSIPVRPLPAPQQAPQNGTT